MFKPTLKLFNMNCLLPLQSSSEKPSFFHVQPTLRVGARLTRRNGQKSRPVLRLFRSKKSVAILRLLVPNNCRSFERLGREKRQPGMRSVVDDAEKSPQIPCTLSPHQRLAFPKLQADSERIGAYDKKHRIDD